jgi:hypothetical protein
MRNNDPAKTLQYLDAAEGLIGRYRQFAETGRYYTGLFNRFRERMNMPRESVKEKASKPNAA